MTQKANYFRLGVFIIVAVAGFVGIVLALSAGNLLNTAFKMETYFNESVQGLDVGSAVKYRGVQIGRVTHVGFSAPKYQQGVPWSQRLQYVLVEAELDPKLVGTEGAPEADRLRRAVERGLRVRLAPVGITGTAYLEIDILDPDANRPLEISWTPENAYIPSAPSTYNQIVRGAQRLMAQLDEADLVRAVKDVAALVRTANDKLTELRVGDLSREATSTMSQMRGLIARIDKLAASPEVHATLRDFAVASASLREALSNPDWRTAPTKAAEAFDAVKAVGDNKHLHEALKNLDRTLARLNALTAASDADVAAALDNLRRATAHLRDLAENARRYPGTIFSEPPRPVVLPQ